MGVLSLNDRAKVVADDLIARAGELGVSCNFVSGATVIDAGIDARGSLSAGVMVARACLADLGHVSIGAGHIDGAEQIAVPQVVVRIDQPVAACMASQYAGWQISIDKYFAMGSGPMRAAYGKEDLYNDIGLREEPNCAVGVLETSELPGADVIGYLSDRCRVDPHTLTLIAARTASITGGVQVTARSVETALHKLHELKFDLTRIVAGFGHAPLPPVASDDIRAIGRTNDAVLYGAQVVLHVTGDDESLQNVGACLPSSTSKDYGRPFAAIFSGYDHDFYKIDPMLFSPAAVCFHNVETGRTFAFGRVNHEVLRASFFDG